MIGDSISCGYTQASDHPTRGYYDAFPSVAQRLLHEQQNSFTVQIETIAYPGITLVNPTESEAEKGMARGMVDRFFHVSDFFFCAMAFLKQERDCTEFTMGCDPFGRI